MDTAEAMRPAELLAELGERGQTLAVAESCTGGLLGGMLTSVAGASEVFWGGVISYDDAAKRRLLGVPADTLERAGAVSRETAEAMAAGVAGIAPTTWGVAVTGIAGPGGGSGEKPVGLVWIAVHGPAPACERFLFEGDRAAVRESAVAAAMRLLHSCVSKT